MINGTSAAIVELDYLVSTGGGPGVERQWGAPELPETKNSYVHGDVKLISLKDHAMIFLDDPTTPEQGLQPMPFIEGPA